MAKDPAFLFYSSDFLIGTAFMSEAEVGQYTRILCHMHQSGHLSIEDMKNICPNISFKVLAKFRTDDEGLYFSERLDVEVTKRKNYSESRRNNRLKVKPETHDTSYVKSYDKTYIPAMSGHMENENINGIKGIKAFSSDDYFRSGEQAFNEIKSDDLFLERLLRIVRGNGLQSCNEIGVMMAVKKFLTIEQAKDEFYHKPKSEVKQHLVNWINKNASAAA